MNKNTSARTGSFGSALAFNFFPSGNRNQNKPDEKLKPPNLDSILLAKTPSIETFCVDGQLMHHMRRRPMHDQAPKGYDKHSSPRSLPNGDDSGLIHMNGSSYDPEFGCMVNMDRFVQIPGHSQNFSSCS